jgi:ribose 5-phosphate isomerase RpiB
VTWDNVKSFRDAAVLATAAVGAWANVASDKAAEATTRTVDSNRSAEAINASNNATSVQLGEQAAGIEHAKLAKP